MAITLGSPPLAGFDQPILLLMDCHRRIERFLNALISVCSDRQGGELSPDERDVLLRATEYFRSAAPRHTQDEEASLFPLMRAGGDPRVATALHDLARLEADHRAADEKHAEVDQLVDRWLKSRRLDEDSVRQLGSRLRELQAIYAEHIALEDDRIFPLAGTVLTDWQLQRVGQEMAQRRGIAFIPERSQEETNGDSRMR